MLSLVVAYDKGANTHRVRSMCVHCLGSYSTVTVTVTVFGTAEPCNPQGSQRLMGYLEQTLHSPKRDPEVRFRILLMMPVTSSVVALVAGCTCSCSSPTLPTLASWTTGRPQLLQPRPCTCACGAASVLFGSRSHSTCTCHQKRWARRISAGCEHDWQREREMTPRCKHPALVRRGPCVTA
jgi:hypothetical protein